MWIDVFSEVNTYVTVVTQVVNFLFIAIHFYWAKHDEHQIKKLRESQVDLMEEIFCCFFLIAYFLWLFTYCAHVFGAALLSVLFIVRIMSFIWLIKIIMDIYTVLVHGVYPE